MHDVMQADLQQFSGGLTGS